jgi:prenyltransferase beta subunit
MKNNIVKSLIKKFEEEIKGLRDNDCSKEVISDEVLLYCFKKAIKKSNKKVSKTNIINDDKAENKIILEKEKNKMLEEIEDLKDLGTIQEIVSYLNENKDNVKDFVVSFRKTNGSLRTISTSSLYIDEENKYLFINDLDEENKSKRVILDNMLNIDFSLRINYFEERFSLVI